jgi:hypothetical protein
MSVCAIPMGYNLSMKRGKEPSNNHLDLALRVNEDILAGYLKNENISIFLLVWHSVTYQCDIIKGKEQGKNE